MPSFSTTTPREQLLFASRALDTSERSTISVNESWNSSSKAFSSPCSPQERRVRFDLKANAAHQASPGHELSSLDIAQQWYSKDDFKVMKSKQRIHLRMMKSGRFNDDDSSDEYCFRGIETDTHKAKRRELQCKMQMELFTGSWCDYDDYFSSDVCLKLQALSAKSAQTARARGHQDHQAALKVYREE